MKSNYKKIGVIVFFVLLITLMAGIYIYNEKNRIDNKNINLKLGNYTVNEIKEDEAGVPNEECGVKLKENNEFEVYMGWGAWHSGKYEINDNKLICKSILVQYEPGPTTKDTDVIFTFDILDTNKLKLESIKVNDTINDKLIYKEGLEEGMTYSIKD